jgi:hypothetical protein
LSAPITLVVIPDECQSIPITAPNDWNQNGWDNLSKNGLTQDLTQRSHTFCQPQRNAPAMKWKISAGIGQVTIRPIEVT